MDKSTQHSSLGSRDSDDEIFEDYLISDIEFKNSDIEFKNTSSSTPPLEASPIRMIVPDDVVNDETNNTTTPAGSCLLSVPSAAPNNVNPPMVEENRPSLDADAGPSTAPIKRKRGRPTGSKNKKITEKKPTIEVPNSCRVVISCPKFESMVVPNDVADGTNNTTPGSCLLSVPYEVPNNANPPMVEENRPSFDADAGPSTGPIKRKFSRPTGSKNRKTAEKKQKTEDPNSRAVISCREFNSMITDEERETGNEELVASVMMRVNAVIRRLCQLKTKGDTSTKTIRKEEALETASSNCTTLNVRTNAKKRIGPVPGVREGDIFYYRAEMSLVGLHKQLVSGIDHFTGKDGAPEDNVATSVVTSGRYNDVAEELDTLIYTGQGGKYCHQELINGNLALLKSSIKGNDVRVIRGLTDPTDKGKIIYIYDGLFKVIDSQKVTGASGFDEFKYRMVRKPDQSRSGYAMWKLAEDLRKSNMTKSRKGLICDDLSNRKEMFPVSVVNEVDGESLEHFHYTRTQFYSSLTLQLHDVDRQSLGCHNCRGVSCSRQDPDCRCIQKNGGELPYHNSILVCRKPMVYECGTSCLCAPDCKNKVVHDGVKIQLEVFKTTNRGWGLRSLEPIRAGTFICEFAGVNKTKEEVGKDDDYVFDSTLISKSFQWNYEPELVNENPQERVPEVFDLPYEVLLSAKKMGNVGRFINHSCSPNVFWQPAEYVGRDEAYVRIGFFAMKHIPPMTELTYDYGVSEVEVNDEDEKIFKGKKICLCGSVKCRGSFG